MVHYNYDPATEMIGNMMFNNPRLHSVSYKQCPKMSFSNASP
jgi:hypothetical protein